MSSTSLPQIAGIPAGRLSSIEYPLFVAAALFTCSGIVFALIEHWLKDWMYTPEQPADYYRKARAGLWLLFCFSLLYLGLALSTPFLRVTSTTTALAAVGVLIYQISAVTRTLTGLVRKTASP